MLECRGAGECQGGGLNSRPRAYESPALPLSYPGQSGREIRQRHAHAQAEKSGQVTLKFAGTIAGIHLIKNVVGAGDRPLEAGRSGRGSGFRAGRQRCCLGSDHGFSDRGDWTLPDEVEINAEDDDQQRDESHVVYESRRCATAWERMKIALVHYSAAPVIGGVETILAAHARLFRRAGHEVRVVCRRGEGEGVILLRENEPLDELRQATAGCDVVFAHNVLTMPFDLPLTEALWTLSMERPDVRWIAWVHDLAACNPDYPLEFSTAPFDRLAKAAPQFRYVAISTHRARQFAELTGRQAQVIPNGIDPVQALGLTPAVAAFAKAHALLHRELVLVHPTRLLRRKRVEFGLEVTAALRARGCDVAYLVTGAGDPHSSRGAEYARELTTLRRTLDLEKIAWFLHEHFPVTAADLASLYSLADALLFPSREEGFGLPILEAALHRLPIFCRAIDPMNTLLEEQLSTYAIDATPEDVAELISRTMQESAAKRARKEVLRRYAWDSIDERHLLPLLAI